MLFKAIVLGAVLYNKRRCFWLHGDVIGDKADGLPYLAARQFLYNANSIWYYTRWEITPAIQSSGLYFLERILARWKSRKGF